ncbi:hypothetical protein Kpol_1018p127 [Vanderwaltozyma polyspora DSM 70294]|uniref:Histidinol-phosphatase n=1 Tax=Vanderwaltozyma polyspora (strain ATCC 22028 / DSM 70294 / BCRC 21397 / CBS 2163 / NBRC 10782 / NRRL Y-8283 / UCD 57-17) TaxID=436907 RepID=A7TDX0_VANPO|nr:uncharacterized protein Kpol_1018p127 [Vanderwaltozyma polyspora DSM 70294]EDO19590.1 hypothetical protein Kpol_1018p127 [Vanderwaltozyma polyspora DSM 70294]
MHSHHSHSGDYVAHGVDKLEDMVSRTIELEFQIYCLTEHMPRINSKFLYPEETSSTKNDTESLEKLQDNFSKFLRHASEIKERNSSKPTAFIIGTEIEGCDIEHIDYAKTILEKHKDTIKFAVGSIHHVNSIPIDFDQKNWNKALSSSKNNIKNFLLDYYELQYIMLQKLKPLVVGHFDLYKLLIPSDLKINIHTGDIAYDDDDVNNMMISDIELENNWEIVQATIIRNLKYINSYGGLIEINTSALRKNLSEPYPGSIICKLVKEHCQGRFVLSDDAHAISHIGTNYKKALEYMTDTIHLDEIYHLEETSNGEIKVVSQPLTEFSRSNFWNNLD